MKELLFTLSLFCLLSFNSFSQKVTYTNLKGAWMSNNTTNGECSASFKFTDSTHLIQSFTAKGITSIDTLFYTLENIPNLTVIHIEGEGKVTKKINEFFCIKIASNDTLKMQGKFDGSKPIKWEDNETPKNTGVMIRIKQN